MAIASKELGATVPSVMAGATLGGMFGTVAGVAVGVVQSVVVGRDRPLPGARRVAVVGGGLATPVVLTFLLTSVTGELVVLWPLLVTAAAAGAASSWWIAPRMADRPRLAEVHRD